MGARAPTHDLLRLAASAIGSAVALFLGAQSAVLPTWVSQLPSEPGKIYAVGIAARVNSPAEGFVKSAANGKLELINRFKTSIHGDTQITQRLAVTVGTGMAAQAAAASFAAQSIHVESAVTGIPGVVVAENFFDPSSHEAYTLVYLDVVMANAEMLKRAQEAESRAQALCDGTECTNANSPSRKTIERIHAFEELRDKVRRDRDTASLLAAASKSYEAFQKLSELSSLLGQQRNALLHLLKFSVTQDGGSCAFVRCSDLITSALLSAGIERSEPDANLRVSFNCEFETNKVAFDSGSVSEDGASFTVLKLRIAVTIGDHDTPLFYSKDFQYKAVGSDLTHAQANLKLVVANKLKSEFLDDLGLKIYNPQAPN